MPWSQDALCAWSWRNEAGQIVDEGVFCPKHTGEVAWPAAAVQLDVTAEGAMLATDVPAAGVWLRAEREGRFEDNGFLIVPGKPKTVRFLNPQGVPSHPGQVRVTHFAELQSALKPSI